MWSQAAYLEALERQALGSFIMWTQIDGGILTATITQHPGAAIEALNCSRLRLVSKAQWDAFLAS